MKPRALLIEDNEVNRYLAHFLLEQAGYEVLEAENGAVGVACARAEAAALSVVVMDIEMPVMDGYTAARLLHTDPATAHLPLVAVTAYAMPGDRSRALEAGFADYLDKPIDPATFAASISRHALFPPSPVTPHELS